MKDKVKYILEAPLKNAEEILDKNYDIIGLKIEEEADKKF